MTSILQILLLILDIAQWIIIAHIIMSWLINFQVLNLRQPLVGANLGWAEPHSGTRLFAGRSFLPQMGGIDFAPLIVLLAVYALRIILIKTPPPFTDLQFLFTLGGPSLTRPT